MLHLTLLGHSEEDSRIFLCKTGKKKLDQSDRYQTYITLKREFGRENYIYDITINRFRQSLARLRLGANGLAINNQFLHKVPDTNCKICKIPETEIHFLLHCPLYVDLRRKYLVTVFDELYKFRSITPLLSNPDITKMRALATFSYHAFKRRQERMPN